MKRIIPLLIVLIAGIYLFTGAVTVVVGPHRIFDIDQEHKKISFLFTVDSIRAGDTTSFLVKQTPRLAAGGTAYLDTIMCGWPARLPGINKDPLKNHGERLERVDVHWFHHLLIKRGATLSEHRFIVQGRMEGFNHFYPAGADTHQTLADAEKAWFNIGVITTNNDGVSYSVGHATDTLLDCTNTDSREDFILPPVDQFRFKLDTDATAETSLVRLIGTVYKK